MELLTAEDFLILIFSIFTVVILAYIVNRIIIFLPSFMGSILTKINNPSIIESNNTLDKNTLEKQTLKLQEEMKIK